MGLENTVLTHLRQLKQTGTVTEYHRAFRNIQVQAITHPVTGAEAVFMFKEGLTRSLRNKLMADSAIQDELTNLDRVVALCKSIEANTPSSDADDHPSQKRLGAASSRTDHPAGKHPKQETKERATTTARGLTIKWLAPDDYVNYKPRPDIKARYGYRGKVDLTSWTRRLDGKPPRCRHCGRADHSKNECRYDFIIKDGKK